jgi:hypothetical protein
MRFDIQLFTQLFEPEISTAFSNQCFTIQVETSMATSDHDHPQNRARAFYGMSDIYLLDAFQSMGEWGAAIDH